MKIILAVVFVFYAKFSFTQNPLVKQWDKRFGGARADKVTSFQQTSDGGYILGGYSYSGAGDDKTDPLLSTMDYWIVKTDSLGNKQWDKDIAPGTVFLSLQQASDRGFIFLGNSGADFLIIKTDSLGNETWSKILGGLDSDVASSVQQTRDGGYILGGTTKSGIGQDKTSPSRDTSLFFGYRDDYWIIKIDANGNKEWDKDFGGLIDDKLRCVQQTSDGGFILGGYSASGIGGDKTQDTRGYYDYWIVKTDSIGNKLWDKDFGGLSGGDWLFSIQQTFDGGYILGGTSNSDNGGDKSEPLCGFYDEWIIRLDSSGNKLWDKDFGGSGVTYCWSAKQTSDGGFIFGGLIVSSGGCDQTESNMSEIQSWNVKTDSLGNIQWDKTLQTLNDSDVTYSLAIQTIDGCYVFATATQAGIGGVKSQASRDTSSSHYERGDYWLIKFCDSTACQAVVPNIVQIGDTLFSGNNYFSYQWYYGSNIIFGATNYFYTPFQNGNYGLIVIDSNGCQSGKIFQYIHTTINDLKETMIIDVSPNPTTSLLKIKSTQPIYHIELFNLLGKIIGGWQYEVSKGEVEIDLSKFSAGIYFLQAGYGEKVWRVKIVKQ